MKLVKGWLARIPVSRARGAGIPEVENFGRFLAAADTEPAHPPDAVLLGDRGPESAQGSSGGKHVLAFE
jgi:hypothetical protein